MTIFDEMVAAYNPHNAIQKTNAQHQVMQQIVLAGLQKGGFFEHAAFYGGTCLRIFHGLPRTYMQRIAKAHSCQDPMALFRGMKAPGNRCRFPKNQIWWCIFRFHLLYGLLKQKTLTYFVP